MSNEDDITWLKEKIAQTRELVARDEDVLNISPSFGLSLSLSSMKQHLSELEHKLVVAQEERSKEVFEVRLIGQKTISGSIPLEMLAKLAQPLNQFLVGAAYWLRYADVPHKGIPETWARTLDLRLAGIGPGSSRLYLTANTAPDLFGDSPTQDAFSSVFGLLNSTPDTFISNLHDVGTRSATGLVEFLKELEKENTAIELKWYSPDNELNLWDGRLDKITFMRNLLETVSTKTEAIEIITGVITLLAATGRIEVIPDGQIQPVKIKYPSGKPELVSGLSLHQRVSLELSKTVTFDPVRDIDVEYYRLINRLPDVKQLI